jgi:predicted phage terminase large subunit-like protein
LMDRAAEWLGTTSAHWIDSEKTWKFPSGATLTFGFLEAEKDKYRYQGSAYQFIGFDELTQFTETQYLYLFSRLRRLKTLAVPVRMRAASNPGGVGHEWVKKRFIDEPGDRVFIPAKVVDNPHIDQQDYISKLQNLDFITRRQLLSGDWTIRQEGTKFKKEWFTKVNTYPIGGRSCRGWDFGSTEGAGDPTCGCRVVRAPDGWLFYVIDMRRAQLNSGGVERLVKKTAADDTVRTKICIEQEPGASGKILVDDYKRRVLSDYIVEPVLARGAKTIRWEIPAQFAENGRIVLLQAPWNDPFLEELCLVPFAEHDDQVDAFTYAILGLITTAAEWDLL